MVGGWYRLHGPGTIPKFDPPMLSPGDLAPLTSAAPAA
jgi:hypothetical protein